MRWQGVTWHLMGRHLQDWLHNLPTNYPGQLAIMGWFLTLTSKMTGFRIPGATTVTSSYVATQASASLPAA